MRDPRYDILFEPIRIGPKVMRNRFYARRRVQERRPRFRTTPEQRDELARRFFAAAEEGDLAALEVLLAANVELTGDGEGKVPALARTVEGRSDVARRLASWLHPDTRIPGVSLRPVEINAGPGALFLDQDQRLLGVMALDIVDGQIQGICSVLNPDKLAHLGPVADWRSGSHSVRSSPRSSSPRGSGAWCYSSAP